MQLRPLLDGYVITPIRLHIRMRISKQDRLIWQGVPETSIETLLVAEKCSLRCYNQILNCPPIIAR